MLSTTNWVPAEVEMEDTLVRSLLAEQRLISRCSSRLRSAPGGTTPCGAWATIWSSDCHSVHLPFKMSGPTPDT